jgi:uncharacterized protein YqjF (DUF2071 family)
MTASPRDPASERPFDALAADREASTVPTPRGDWIMGQGWRDLLFLSWPVPLDVVRPMVPSEVEIDTYDGAAWVSAVPFWMDRAHFRGLPPIPMISSFPEVNVRTYVRSGDHRAIWFLSLDTQSHLNVFLARHAFHLPYVYADVEMDRGADIRFSSVRPHGEAAFDVRYRASGDPMEPSPGSLEHFLTERYSMVCADQDGDLYRGDIQHDPWRVSEADWTASALDLLGVMGFDVTQREPLVFYAASTDVALWAPVRI